MIAAIGLGLLFLGGVARAQDAAQTAAPPTDAEAAVWQQKAADVADFKQRLFTLAGSFTRGRTTQGDIEAVMGVTFTSDPDGETFGAPASPGKVSAQGFKSLDIKQHVRPGSQLYDNEDYTPPAVPGAIAYGFESTELGVFPMGTCLSLTELKAHFATTTGWHYVQMSMFYPGVAAVHDGAEIYAFIDPDSLVIDPADEAEFNRLNDDPDLNPDKLRQLDEIKARIDGCVFILGLR